MIQHITVSQSDSSVTVDLAPEAWAIIDLWCLRHRQTREHAIHAVLNLGLAYLYDQMAKEDAQ